MENAHAGRQTPLHVLVVQRSLAIVKLIIPMYMSVINAKYSNRFNIQHNANRPTRGHQDDAKTRIRVSGLIIYPLTQS